MNTPVNNTGKASTHHPMMIAAAIAVVLFCLAGTAAILGWIPSSLNSASSNSSGELTATDRAAMASRLADTDPGLTAAATGVEAQRERDRLAQVQRDADQRQRNTEQRQRERDTAPAVRQAEPVRLAAAAPAAPAKNWCGNCGNVESVREIKTRAQGSGLGAAGGAVLGGLLGNQIGGGNGRKLATVAGAVGGAVVGNQVEGNMKATISYDVHVRLDDGKSRTFRLQNLNGFSAGDRIKVVKGALRHAS